MSHIKVILWDIDGTILDFDASERAAIRKGFRNNHLGEVTDEMIADYSELNKGFWERLERKELTKIQVLEGRFEAFFTKWGIPHTPELVTKFNDDYQIDLGDTICVRDDAVNLIHEFHEQGIWQGVITNGTGGSQARKLKETGLEELLHGHIYISEVVGYEKPDPLFFAPLLKSLPADIQRDQILVVGDSLTSDVQGGINIGAKTCWYNHKHLPNTKGIPVDYEIDNLQKVREMI